MYWALNACARILPSEITMSALNPLRTKCPEDGQSTSGLQVLRASMTVIPDGMTGCMVMLANDSVHVSLHTDDAESC